MHINENVEVTTDHSGTPLAFTWRHVRYIIVSEPERWLAKVPWWRERHTLLERELWRVSALPCSGPRSLHTPTPEEGTYDLSVEHIKNAAGAASAQWMLTEAHTEELDAQLFA